MSRADGVAADGHDTRATREFITFCGTLASSRRLVSVRSAPPSAGDGHHTYEGASTADTVVPHRSPQTGDSDAAP
jgi:hypothetical protein